MDFVLSMLGRVDADKHTMVLKEIISLVNRYPNLLTANVVNRVSSLEDVVSSAARWEGECVIFMPYSMTYAPSAP